MSGVTFPVKFNDRLRQLNREDAVEHDARRRPSPG